MTAEQKSSLIVRLPARDLLGELDRQFEILDNFEWFNAITHDHFRSWLKRLPKDQRVGLKEARRAAHTGPRPFWEYTLAGAPFLCDAGFFGDDGHLVEPPIQGHSLSGSTVERLHAAVERWFASQRSAQGAAA